MKKYNKTQITHEFLTGGTNAVEGLIVSGRASKRSCVCALKELSQKYNVSQEAVLAFKQVLISAGYIKNEKGVGDIGRYKVSTVGGPLVFARVPVNHLGVEAGDYVSVSFEQGRAVVTAD